MAFCSLTHGLWMLLPQPVVAKVVTAGQLLSNSRQPGLDCFHVLVSDEKRWISEVKTQNSRQICDRLSWGLSPSKKNTRAWPKAREKISFKENLWSLKYYVVSLASIKARQEESGTFPPLPPPIFVTWSGVVNSPFPFLCFSLPSGCKTLCLWCWWETHAGFKCWETWEVMQFPSSFLKERDYFTVH